MQGPTKKVKRLQDLCFLASPLFANASINDVLRLSEEIASIVKARGESVVDLVGKKLRKETGCNITVVLRCNLAKTYEIKCHVVLAYDDKKIAAEFLDEYFVCYVLGLAFHFDYGAEVDVPASPSFPVEQVKKLIACGIYKKAQDMIRELMDKTMEELNILIEHWPFSHAFSYALHEPLSKLCP